MLKEIRQETTVKPGGIIELAPTDLPAGTSVEVIVVLNGESKQSATNSSNNEKWASFYENVVGAWKEEDEMG